MCVNKNKGWKNSQLNLNMQRVGLSITFQQLKLKVIEITPTKPTTFQNGVPKGSWGIGLKNIIQKSTYVL